MNEAPVLVATLAACPLSRANIVQASTYHPNLFDNFAVGKP